MFTSALRQGFRRVAVASNTPATQRGFATVGAKVAKSDNARKALVAGAGLTLAVAALQQREVSLSELDIFAIIVCSEENTKNNYGGFS